MAGEEDNGVTRSTEVIRRAKSAIDLGIRREPSRQMVTSLSLVILELCEEYKTAVHQALRLEAVLHEREKGDA